MKLKKMGKKGITVSSFIIGLILLGAVVLYSVSSVQDLNTVYNKNFNVSKIQKYDRTETGLNLSRNLVDTITKKEADTSLSFLNLPLFVWSALKTTITGALSAPSILLGLVSDVSADLGLPSWIDEVIIGIISLLLITSIISIVLRTGEA